MWRCTGQGVGAQCVMMAGVEMMLQWYADSWDIPLMASYALNNVKMNILTCVLLILQVLQLSAVLLLAKDLSQYS